MACRAALKYAYKAVCNRGPTADEVWSIVRWWTPATIDEALQELVKNGVVRNAGGRFYRIAVPEP